MTTGFGDVEDQFCFAGEQPSDRRGGFNVAYMLFVLLRAVSAISAILR